MTVINGVETSKTAMRGTDSAATVADGWDSALATILDNFTSTRIGYLDELAAANLPTDVADVKTVADAIQTVTDAIATLSETGGTLTADGSEQNVIIVDSPSGVFKPLKVKIDLSNMVGGETTVVKEYYRIKNGGSYIKKDEVTYSGAQDLDLINIELEPNRFGFKVTLEQSAGTNRNYDWGYIYED